MPGGRNQEECAVSVVQPVVKAGRAIVLRRSAEGDSKRFQDFVGVAACLAVGIGQDEAAALVAAHLRQPAYAQTREGKLTKHEKAS